MRLLSGPICIPICTYCVRNGPKLPTRHGSAASSVVAAPEMEPHRLLLARTTPATAQIRLVGVVHGSVGPDADSGDERATLIVLDLRFGTSATSGRIKRAKIHLQISSTRGGQHGIYTIQRLAPDRRLNLAPHWGSVIGFVERDDRTGTSTAGWVVDENAATRGGIPSRLQVAVLIRRRSDQPFPVRFGVEIEVSAWLPGAALVKPRGRAVDSTSDFDPSVPEIGDLPVDRTRLGNAAAFDNLFQVGDPPRGHAPFSDLFPGDDNAEEPPKIGKTRIYVGLAVKVAERGLEGFGGGMLAFAALKPNIGGLAAQLGIGIPAFFGIVFPPLCTIFPWLEHKKESLTQAADRFVQSAELGDGVRYAVGRSLLEANGRVLALQTQTASETATDIVGCLAGVLWNLAAGNGLVQNGFVGLISSATAGTSVFLSWCCCHYGSKRLDLIGSSLEDIRAGVDRLQYWIAAPILVGLGCAIASVLGAAYLFHNSGGAESEVDRETEKDDFLVGQLYPAAVNFILLARYLAELAYLKFRLFKQETDIAALVERTKKISEWVDDVMKDKEKRSKIAQAISEGEPEESTAQASSSGGTAETTPTPRSGDAGSNRNMLLRLARLLGDEAIILLLEDEPPFTDDRSSTTGTRRLQAWLRQEIERREGGTQASGSDGR